jgi:tetratricopeptide (TPR) repeat protein
MMKHLAIFAAVAILIIGCSNKNTPAESTLGTISFTPYGSDIAQPHFQKGLLLMHNFEYDDARTNFLEAQRLDSNFHMAYWGEAMTYNHTLWHSQYTEEGREALNKLAPTGEERVALMTNEIEADLMQGVNILFGIGDDKLERDAAYSEYMHTLYVKHEGNHEVAAFYALSLLGSEPERNVETYSKGAKIAQGILEENPQHPGALHYLIHSYDDPDHAHLALEAANSYAVVAKDAGHALHMPSHIYVAKGMWDEVVSSNIASFAASEDRMERLDLDNNALGYHAFQWLMYGHLQRNDIQEAKQLLLDMKGYHDELSSKKARAYLTMMRAGYLVGSEDWDSEFVDYEIDDAALNVSLRAVNSFVAGMAAYQNNDGESLQLTIAQMAEERDAEYKKMMQRSSSTCSGVNWTSQLPSEQDINNAHIMEMQLKAANAILDDDMTEAEKWLVAAADLEDNTAYSFGPPSVVKPAHEMYGEWLFQMNRQQESIEEFVKANAKAPGRRHIADGLRLGLDDASPSI